MLQLMEKIKSHEAVVGVVGLGYVGFPLSMLNARTFKVIGYDIDPRVIRDLALGLPVVEGVPAETLISCLGRTFFPTSQESELDGCDVFIICVPTPLTAHNEPDLRALTDASKLVRRHLHQGGLVVLESTTYPGTTDSVMVPILEERGMKAGTDFYVAYSPERIDPGRTDAELKTVPKIVGGYDRDSAMVASQFLQASFERVVPVRDCRTAEATKMLENIFRAVNIALVNEICLALEKMDVDMWEVIEAAATKPYGFMAFQPGPGIGGHCIPLDPYYFSYAAKRVGVLTRFIELSGQVNAFMPFHVLQLLENALRAAGKTLRGSRVAVLGLSYKKNVSDTRESPSAKVIEEVVRHGGSVKAYDPLAKGIQTASGFFQSESSVESALKNADAAILLVDHSTFHGLPDAVFQSSMKSNPVVVDCTNILVAPPKGMIYVGLGKRDTSLTVTASRSV